MMLVLEKKSYRSFVPRTSEKELDGVDQEKRVDDHEQVVRVPECIESRESVQRPWKLHQAATDPVGGEQHGDCHKNYHENARDCHWRHGNVSVCGVLVELVAESLKELFIVTIDKFWDIAGYVKSSMHEHSHCYSCSDTLHSPVSQIQFRRHNLTISNLLTAFLPTC